MVICGILSTFRLNMGILCKVMSVPHNIVMDSNNVMPSCVRHIQHLLFKRGVPQTNSIPLRGIHAWWTTCGHSYHPNNVVFSPQFSGGLHYTLRGRGGVPNRVDRSDEVLLTPD